MRESIEHFFRGGGESENHDDGMLKRLGIPRTLVLGVGGSGCLAVQWALRSLYDRLGHQPASCQFLVIDTTDEDANAPRSLPVGDFVKISGFNANHYFEFAENFKFLDWLPARNYLPGEINMGAHGMPHVGRLCYFMFREGKIKPAIIGKLAELTRENLNGDLQPMDGVDSLEVNSSARVTVHIAASLCGGTGAGCLLDLAFDVRRWCEEFTGHPPFIVAHLVLPEALQLGSSEAVNMQHRANAFSLLCQINHFMGKNEAWIQYKRGSKVHWPAKDSPFQICFLLDGASEANTTHREKIGERIGRMIGIMSAERAGKGIWDAIDNVFTKMRPDDDDMTRLPAYSSYEIASGKRPVQKVLARFEDQMLQCFADLEDTPESLAAHESKEIPVVHKVRSAVNLEKLAESYMRPLQKEMQAVADAVNEPQRNYDAESAGRQIKNTIVSFLENQRKQAKVDVRRDARKWLNNEFQPVRRDLLENWLENDDYRVESLPKFLATVKQQMRRKLKPRKKPENAAAAVRKLFDHNAPDRWYESRERALKSLETFVVAALETAWSEVYAEMIQQEIGEWIDQCQSDLRALRKNCADRLALQKKMGRRRKSSEFELYDPPAALAIDQNGELKKAILVDVLAESENSAGDIDAVRARLGRPGELQDRLNKMLETYFSSCETNADQRGNAMARQIKDGMKKVIEAAAPRWLIQPHKRSDIEKISRAIFPPKQALVNAVKDLEKIETVVDPTYKDRVVIVKSEHGAALSYLQSFNLYCDAFEETVKNRKIKDHEMWLDQNWKQIEIPKGEFLKRNLKHAYLTFALAAQEGRIHVSGTECRYQNSDRRGESELLGTTISEALDCWCSMENEGRVERECKRLDDLTTREQIERTSASVRMFQKLREKHPNSIPIQEATSTLESHLQTLQELADFQQAGERSEPSSQEKKERAPLDVDRELESRDVDKSAENPISGKLIATFMLLSGSGRIECDKDGYQFFLDENDKTSVALGTDLESSIRNWARMENGAVASVEFLQLKGQRVDQSLVVKATEFFEERKEVEKPDGSPFYDRVSKVMEDDSINRWFHPSPKNEKTKDPSEDQSD